MFLSRLMNRSREWTVLHEPPPLSDSLQAVQPLFNRERYGEVNSYRLPLLHVLQVRRKGVIVRHPHALLCSLANRGHDFAVKVHELVHSLSLIHSAIAQSIAEPISFRMMTSSVPYCRDLLQSFGVLDVAITERTLTKKINASAGPYRSIDDVPAQWREPFKKQSEWFIRQYDALL